MWLFIFSNDDNEIKWIISVQFVGASIGDSYVKISSEETSGQVYSFIPAQAFCVLEFVPGGTLKKLLMRNRRKKLDFDVAIQLALDLSRG